MSKSNLETSQADTDHSSTSEDNLDFFPQNSPPQTEPKQANALSILYAAAMAVISALLLRKHSRKWKQWSAIVGVLFYSLGKIAMRGGAQKWVVWFFQWRHFSLSFYRSHLLNYWRKATEPRRVCKISTKVKEIWNPGRPTNWKPLKKSNTFV